MNLIKRLLNIGKAEAESMVDKLEDPIKLTEQGIRDLEMQLDSAIKALAEVKALSIRTEKQYQEYRLNAVDYEKKAILILKKAQSGDLDEAEGDRLASEALLLKEQNLTHANSTKEEYEKIAKNLYHQSQGNY